MTLSAKTIVIGLVTNIPGLRGIDGRTTGGTHSARYCYAVWMRHLVLLSESGQLKPISTLLELGPGDSIGTGIAALLSGVDRYIGIDVNRYATIERNLEVLD